MDFPKFQAALGAQFKKMQKHAMFRTTVEKDAMWATYLGSFPEGSNPIYRVRTEHDCSCCRHFIRDVGSVVAVVDGKLVSIWDVKMPDEPEYQVVADAMAALVKSFAIGDEFLHTEKSAGATHTIEELENGGTHKWNHFFVMIPQQYVVPKKDLGTKLNVMRSTHDTLARALAEIPLAEVDLVLELMDQDSVYRLQEQAFAVKSFRKLLVEYLAIGSAVERDLFVWAKLPGLSGAVSGLRGSMVGTLLLDLAKGVDLEEAVRKYESMAAPSNYKRSKSLITQKQKDAAKEKVVELGLTSALQRRHAKATDISVVDTLFMHTSTKAVELEDDAFAGVAVAAKGGTGSKSLERLTEMPVEAFLRDVVPTAKAIEVLFEGRLASNLMSLMAPADPTANQLLKWKNGFSWAYRGDVADSIKERVKAAGGNVTGDLCCRLAWSNYDDLDFHMVEPGGYEIYFSNRNSTSPCGGRLDVDANAGGGSANHGTRTPVENIFYASKSAMKEGTYVLSVHQFRKVESVDVGFEVEVDFMGTVYRFSYPQAVVNRSTVEVAKLHYSKKDGLRVETKLPMTSQSKDMWGVKTETYIPVKMAMLSPNYWVDADSEEEAETESGTGNKHYFFMMDGCASDEPMRGFFNEQLHSVLKPHSKVFEVLGSSLMVAPAQEQLSGLGFSSSQRNTAVFRVTGAHTRLIKVSF